MPWSSRREAGPPHQGPRAQGDTAPAAPVSSVPLWDEVRGGLVLSTIEALVARVPGFELQFLPEPGVGPFLRDFLEREVRGC